MHARDNACHSEDLLIYLEEYGVVICKECQFAVQPSALASHLLRHRVYRDERKRLLQKYSRVRLLEPDDVVLPLRRTGPVPFLSVQKGLRCSFGEDERKSGVESCEHACVSKKRMSQHWSEKHGEHEAKNVRCRDAWLQTFFRGNKVRYFEVEVDGDGIGEEEASACVEEVGGRQVKRRKKDDIAGSNSSACTTESPTEPRTTESLSFSPSEPPANPLMGLDMQTLQYFHHYTISTTLTIRRSASESEHFWTTLIPQYAFRHPFLMYALLGLSAIHQAFLSVDEDPKSARVHREKAVEFQTAALADFKYRPDEENSTALVAFGRFLGIQRVVQQNLEWMLGLDVPTCTGVDTVYAENRQFSGLLEFVFLLRGSREMTMMLQPLLPKGSDLSIAVEALDDAAASTQAYQESNVFRIPPPILHRLQQLQAHQLTTEPSLLECLNLLTRAIALSYSPSSPAPDIIWESIEYWIRYLPDRYIHRLSSANPGALVIFAHWLMLAQRLESHYWFCKGQARRMLSIVEANLPPEKGWRELVGGLLS